MNFVLLLLVLGLMGIIVKPFLSELKIATSDNFPAYIFQNVKVLIFHRTVRLSGIRME